MDIRPILTTLRRHKTAALLIVLEIALSCAIICNALFLIGNRLERMQRPSGVDESHLVVLKFNGVSQDADAAAVTRADLQQLRSLPGVRSAAVVSQIPFGSSASNSGIRLDPEAKNSVITATNYMVGEGGLATFGVNVVDGRDFLPEEYVDDTGDEAHYGTVLLTRALATRLFGQQRAIGQAIYVWDNTPSRVVGIIEHLPKPHERGPSADYDVAMVFPGRTTYMGGGIYAINVADPARRATVLEQARRQLQASGPTRIVSRGVNASIEELRAKYYRSDRAMAWLLVTVSIALLVVTALGIVGLASFWVGQRTQQIGIRRALGATRGQILRYFQTENFLLASAGIVLGMLLAYAINQLLMSKYELPRLPLAYLPVGAVVLWLLGQLAVLWPARRAAAVPPAAATRAA
jgi:putative ABC transport system permease protein